MLRMVISWVFFHVKFVDLIILISSTDGAHNEVL